MSFSVLMSIYHKEDPQYLIDCLVSLAKQTLKSGDVVVVHDGPLTEGLYQVLAKWKKLLPIKEVVINKNVGLGQALNEGLKYCKYDLVARVDTDDINIASRFEIQYNFMIEHPDVAICGSHINEFDADPEITTSRRNVPIGDDLTNSIFRRNPFNHMTVMFRKSAVLDAGGYQDLPFMEDYFLWVRMYLKKYKLVNLDTVFVNARIGNGMLERRKGYNYYKSELRFMLYLLNSNISNKFLALSIFFVRAHLRLLPSFMLKRIYLFIRN